MPNIVAEGNHTVMTGGVGHFRIPGEATRREYAVYVMVAQHRETGDLYLYVGKTGDNKEGCNPVISRAGNHFSFNKVHSQMRNKFPSHPEHRRIVADVTGVPDVGRFDLWHDRAAFHFLTDPGDRRKYVALLDRTVPAGGHAIIATFAHDGPEKCSGLGVVRYDAASLGRELGPKYALRRTVHETHLTPRGKPQSFQYSLFQRAG